MSRTLLILAALVAAQQPAQAGDLSCSDQSALCQMQRQSERERQENRLRSLEQAERDQSWREYFDRMRELDR